jgi:hypothetical protein
VSLAWSRLALSRRVSGHGPWISTANKAASTATGASAVFGPRRLMHADADAHADADVPSVSASVGQGGLDNVDSFDADEVLSQVEQMNDLDDGTGTGGPKVIVKAVPKPKTKAKAKAKGSTKGAKWPDEEKLIVFKALDKHMYFDDKKGDDFAKSAVGSKDDCMNNALAELATSNTFEHQQEKITAKAVESMVQRTLKDFKEKFALRATRQKNEQKADEATGGGAVVGPLSVSEQLAKQVESALEKKEARKARLAASETAAQELELKKTAARESRAKAALAVTRLDAKAHRRSTGSSTSSSAAATGLDWENDETFANDEDPVSSSGQSLTPAKRPLDPMSQLMTVVSGLVEQRKLHQEAIQQQLAARFPLPSALAVPAVSAVVAPPARDDELHERVNRVEASITTLANQLGQFLEAFKQGPPQPQQHEQPQ